MKVEPFYQEAVEQDYKGLRVHSGVGLTASRKAVL